MSQKSYIMKIALLAGLLGVRAWGAESDQNSSTPVTAYSNPAAAYNAWAVATNNPQEQSKAVDYLRMTIEADAPDTNLVFDACAQLAKIYAANRQTNAVIEIRRRQLALAEGDPVQVYAAAIPLSDALVAVGDDPGAIQVLTETMEKYRVMPWFNTGWTKVTAIYRRQRVVEPVVQLCAKFLAHDIDSEMIYPVVTTLAASYSTLKDYENAAKTLNNFLDRHRNPSNVAHVAAVAKTLANIQAVNQGVPDAAVKLLDRELSSMSADDIQQRVELAAAKAVILQKYKGDMVAAAEQYRAVLEISTNPLPVAVATDVYLNLAAIQHEAGETARAAQLLLDGLRLYGAPLSGRIVMQLIDITDDEETLMKAVWILHEKIVAEIRGRMLAEPYQTDVVRLLVRAGKAQEALQESRVLLYTCPDASLPAAVEMVAWVFKANDGNLARANLFLKYQKYGPAGEDGRLGTPDDLPNILMQVPLIADERRLKMYDEYVKTLPTDWSGYKKRGDMLLYLDQPLAAFNAYRRAFELCPLVEKDLQSVADGLAACIVRTTRDVAIAERLVEYIMFGPAGKDLRIDTADDITDPMAEILAAIQYSGKPSGDAQVSEQPKPGDAVTPSAKHEKQTESRAGN